MTWGIKLRRTLVWLILVLLIFQLILLYRNEFYSKSTMYMKGLADMNSQYLRKPLEVSDIQASKILSQGINLQGDWRETARLFKVSTLNNRYLTLGIPTIRRQNVSYIFSTMESLLNHTDKNDLKEVYFVILLADFDEQWKNKMAESFKHKYPDLTNDGTLQIIQAPKSFYPTLENLKHTYQDPDSKIKWRSKQNVDYAFQFLYSSNFSTYYMQLEDDIYTVDGYFTAIKDYIEKYEGNWVCMEFSELGFIGKLFHSSNLEKLAKMTLLFYEEQPVDFTFLYFNIMMLQWQRIIRRPTLFQHVGWHSSYPGKLQPLKDRFFDNVKKTYKGDNPPAKCFTTLQTVPEFPPQMAYDLEDGYFWSHGPAKSKDTFTVVFKEPQNIDKVIIKTGSREHVTDKIENAVLEASLALVEIKDNSAVCTNDISLGEFKNGTIEVSDIAKKMGPFKIYCLRITLTKDQIWWIIIKEIAVFLSISEPKTN